MKNSFIGDILKVGITNFAIILFGIGTSIITARVLGPDKNGIIAALTVYPSLFMTIGSLGIRQSTTFFIGKNIFPEKSIKMAITQIWLLTSILSLVICFILMKYFSRYGDDSYYILLSIIPIPFALFNTYNSGIFLGKNNIRSFNKINWIPHFSIFVLTIALIVVFKFNISGALIALIGGPFLMFILLLSKNEFLKYFSFKIKLDIIKRMLSLGLVYAFALLIINLNYKADIILLDKLSNPFELGIYSKGANIIQYLWQIPMVLSTIVFSRSATAKNGFDFSLKVSQLLRVSLIIVGLGSFILYFLSHYVILGLYGSDFYESINVLKILLPGVVLMTVFKVMNMDLAGKGKPWVSLKAMLPALILNILLNIIWIPNFGSNGAALASTISYSFAAFLFIYFYCSETKLTLRTLFNFRKKDFDPIINVIKNKSKI